MKKSICVWRIFSRWLLKELTELTSTALCGKLFHRFKTRTEKKYSRASHLLCAFASFHLWPRVHLPYMRSWRAVSLRQLSFLFALLHTFSRTMDDDDYDSLDISEKVKGNCIAVHGTPSHSYGVSLAIWDHTVLPATRHKWTHPAFTRASQAGTRFTYLGVMEGWVDLGDLLHTKTV